MNFSTREKHPWLFYIGTYSPENEPGIHLAALNTDSGEMEVVGGTSGVENPSFLALHPQGDRLYAVTETDEGEVVSFAISPGGELAEQGRVQTGGAHPCHISFSPAGCLISVNYSGGQVSSYTLDDRRIISGVASRIQHSGSGPNRERQEKAHPHSAIPDRHGKFVYVSDLGLDKIVVYRLEQDRLVRHKEISLPPGTGPRHFAIDAAERYAYGVDELSNTVTVYAYDAEAGNLSLLQQISTLPEHLQQECTAADIHISPDGRYLYASNRGFDSLVRFAINPEDGRLSDPFWSVSGGTTPRNFTLAPGGFLLAANQDSDAVVSFRIDPKSGKLQETGFRLSVPKPVCLVGRNPQEKV